MTAGPKDLSKAQVVHRVQLTRVDLRLNLLCRLRRLCLHSSTVLLDWIAMWRVREPGPKCKPRGSTSVWVTFASPPSRLIGQPVRRKPLSRASGAWEPKSSPTHAHSPSVCVPIALRAAWFVDLKGHRTGSHAPQEIDRTPSLCIHGGDTRIASDCVICVSYVTLNHKSARITQQQRQIHSSHYRKPTLFSRSTC